MFYSALKSIKPRLAAESERRPFSILTSTKDSLTAPEKGRAIFLCWKSQNSTSGAPQARATMYFHRRGLFL